MKIDTEINHCAGCYLKKLWFSVFFVFCEITGRYSTSLSHFCLFLKAKKAALT